MEVSLNPRTDFILKLPYNLELKDVRLEDNLHHDPATELEWMANNVVDDEEAFRIFVATVILMQVLTPTPDFAAALHTAIVWERG